ncbi:MAG TPA: TIGR04255 family protein [Bacteroidales bacterium]|nr:TIGR04255 family protein [Bacteroidales bacterium]
MAIHEVFPKPLVKQVIFQIRFPNLFYIENKIGDIQLKIMKKFPVSNLLVQKQFLFADVNQESSLEEIKANISPNVNKKIWQFRSEDGVVLNILPDSLDMTSTSHKTYNNEGSEHRFRDVIQFVVDAFLRETGIPIINRIGLRYIDEGPVFENTNDSFSSCYNSIFNLGRFDLRTVNAFNSIASIQVDGNTYVNYREELQKTEAGSKLTLDFDGVSNNIDVERYLEVLDRLHEIISNEFEKTIQPRIYDYMKEKS